MGKTRFMKDGMDGKMFVSRQSRQFLFEDIMIKSAFLYLYLELACKKLSYPPRKRYIKDKRKDHYDYIFFVAFGNVKIFLNTLTVCFGWNFSLIIRRDIHFCYRIQKSIQSSQLTDFFPRNDGNFEEKEKFREIKFERNTWKYKEQSVAKHTLCGMAQEYNYQVSEEIEGRVTKIFSKEFSRMEPRILGALYKLDEFNLNPQVRTCSVVVPGTSTNNDS